MIIVANVWWCFDNIKPNHHQIILYSTHTNYKIDKTWLFFGTDGLRRVSYHFINSGHPNQYPILPKKQLPTMEFIPQIRYVLVLIIIRQNFGHAEWHILPQYVILFCLRLYIRLDILYYYITSDTNHNYETDHHLEKLLGLQMLCIKHSNLTTMWQ